MVINTYNPVFNAAYDEIVRKLDICGVIPLVQIEDKRNALPLAGALMSADVTAAEIITDLTGIKAIRDVSIEEAGIDDIIRIAYGDGARM